MPAAMLCCSAVPHSLLCTGGVPPSFCSNYELFTPVFFFNLSNYFCYTVPVIYQLVTICVFLKYLKICAHMINNPYYLEF